MKRLAVALSLLLCPALGTAKDQPIKTSTITNGSEPASAEMTKFFWQKSGTHPNLFTLVNNDDPSLRWLTQNQPSARKA